MKKAICAALALLMMLAVPALASGRLSEALMIYEDYDGNRAEQTIDTAAELDEIEGILLRASKHPAELDGCTLNCTLFCMTPNGEVYDFAVATDGCPFIVSNVDGKVFELEGDDHARLKELFDVIYEGMGYDAIDILGW